MSRKLHYVNAQVTSCQPKYNLFQPRWETHRLLHTNYSAASVSRKSEFGSEWYVPTHTLWRVKAPLQKKRRSIRHPQPWAILHLAGTLRWQTVAWVSTCFTVQKDNSVIICGPDLEPHNTDLVLSSIKPTGENYQVPFLEVSCHYKRERTVEWSIWYEAVQTQKPLQRVFICQTSRFGSGNKTEKSD